MNFKQEIEFYGEDIKNFENSPFELIEAFHRRSMLCNHFDKLTTEEKALLREHDLILWKTAKQVFEHVKKAYDFQSDKPIHEWWWHLDKVVNKQLTLNQELGTVSHRTFL